MSVPTVAVRTTRAGVATAHRPLPVDRGGACGERGGRALRRDDRCYAARATATARGWEPRRMGGGLAAVERATSRGRETRRGGANHVAWAGDLPRGRGLRRGGENYYDDDDEAAALDEELDPEDADELDPEPEPEDEDPPPELPADVPLPDVPLPEEVLPEDVPALVDVACAQGALQAPVPPAPEHRAAHATAEVCTA